MASLHLAFQEGFTGDTVVAHVNNKEVYRKTNVQTRLQTGYADSVEVPVAEGETRVAISLPDRHLSEKIVVKVAAPTYVGISIVNGKLVHRVSLEPFGYL